jgi:hypothetical protein
VIELVEQRALGLEAKEAVVGLGALADLIRHLAHAPGLIVLRLAAGRDALAGLFGDLVATLVRNLGIEHQHELVFGCLRCCRQNGG